MKSILAQILVLVFTLNAVSGSDESPEKFGQVDNWNILSQLKTEVIANATSEEDAYHTFPDSLVMAALDQAEPSQRFIFARELPLLVSFCKDSKAIGGKLIPVSKELLANKGLLAKYFNSWLGDVMSLTRRKDFDSRMKNEMFRKYVVLSYYATWCVAQSEGVEKEVGKSVSIASLPAIIKKIDNIEKLLPEDQAQVILFLCNGDGKKGSRRQFFEWLK